MADDKEIKTQDASAEAGDQPSETESREKVEVQAKEAVEPTRFPAKVIFGKKVGMGRVFADNGDLIPVTFIEAGPCVVTQIKTTQKDGYEACQLAFGTKKEKLINKPLAGHLKQSGLRTTRYLREVRVDSTEGIVLGQEVKVDVFSKGEMVCVTAISKGLGFQGTVRRHGFKGGPKTHGQSDRLRAPGSIGQSSSPSRVFKGMKMAGRMGKDTVTVKNLQVVGVDLDRNYLMVRGAIPGKPNTLVRVAARK